MSSQIPTRRRLAILVAAAIAFSLLFFVASSVTGYMGARFLKVESLLINLDALRTTAGDIDTSERGFLLTSDQQYLDPLRQANLAMPDLIASIAENVRDQDKDLQSRVSQFTALVQNRASLANKIVELERVDGSSAARKAEQPQEVERIMNDIRSSIRVLHRRINADQSRYAKAQSQLNLAAFLLIAVGTSLMLVTVIRLYSAAVASLKSRELMYEQLQGLNINLEGEVERRTRDLKAANEELQQFAYVASHDLQEPLRTVTSFSQLLEARYKGKLGEDADEFIAYIVNSSRRMTDLINGLLALVRLRRGGQPTEPVSFDSMLGEVQGTLQASLREAQAEVTIDSKLPALVVDRSQILQVLENLLSNSVKYRSERHLVIHISAQQSPTEWVFCVADNGRGFDQQYADRIFGLFQRLHIQEVPGGTGMGLSISRKAIERHGGRMWAESTVGSGAKFFFSLPVSLDLSRDQDKDQSRQGALARSV